MGAGQSAGRRTSSTELSLKAENGSDVRRALDAGDLPATALVELAAELFRGCDAEETAPDRGDSGQRGQVHEEREVRLKIVEEPDISGHQFASLALGQGEIEAVIHGDPEAGCNLSGPI